MTRPRKTDRDLTELLHRTTLPIAVFDEQRRIVYANSSLGSWIGVDAPSLLGLKCEYHSHAPAANETPPVENQICPPPQAFHGELVEAYVVCRSGKGLRRRLVQFVPLGDSPLDCVGVVAFFASEDESGDAAERLDIDATSDELHLAVSARLTEFREHRAADSLVGQSAAMQHVAQQVRLAQTGTSRTVVVGPAGTGREHIARLIHYGRAADGTPLTPLSCNLLDKELLETTVTTIVRRHAELRSEDNPNLLLLDVDQLPVDAQGDLAGLLSMPELAFSTISTSACSLISLAREGKYHADLAYALSTLVIELPTLASRRGDIPLLAQHFLEAANIGGSKQLGGFSEKAMDLLVEFPWPGHVEQLREMVAAAHRQADGPLIDAESLPNEIHHFLAIDLPASDERIDLDLFLAEIEAEVLRRALKKSRGNKAAAARMLGISRPRLLRRISQLLPSEA